MSLTFGNILCDLNISKINPSKSNTDTYASSVQDWLRTKIIELGLPVNCHTLDEWVTGDFSHDFKKEATRLWALSNYTLGHIKTKHKAFFNKVVPFPGM